MRHAARVERRGPPLSPRSRALAIAGSLVLSACGGSRGPTPTAELPPAAATKPVADTSAGALHSSPALDEDWVERTSSPRPAPPPDPALVEWLALCGRGEEPLHEVAQEVAAHWDAEGELPLPEWTVHRLRQRGAPYVTPRVWAARLPSDAQEEGLEAFGDRLEAWARRGSRGVLRCGIGELEGADGSRVVALVQVEARADLAPLPTRAPVGTWLDLGATLLVPATGTALVVLPPEGLPRVVNLRGEGDQLRARLLVDRPGSWLVQLLANDEGGPLPVLEARLNVGDGASAPPWQVTAPGEDAAGAELAPEEALLAMINEARRRTGLSPLAPDPTLSTLARRHAEHLRSRGRVSHDVGFGSPERRVEEAGLTPRAVGENVARAPSLLRTYRALWASPSHRGNLLEPRFDAVGIGVTRDDAGMLYTALLFVAAR